MQLTLLAEARAATSVPLPRGFAARVPDLSDAEDLGRLYFECPVPGMDAPDSAGGAISDMHSFFRGDYGEPWLDGSGLVEGRGRLVAALLAVRSAVWDDTPDCPFITDLFTDRAFRRSGLAHVLMVRCMNQASATPRPMVALRADSDNAPAMRLYERLGFRPVVS
jgi:ribosomal protein S18 acetylase RimI-like enzyme